MRSGPEHSPSRRRGVGRAQRQGRNRRDDRRASAAGDTLLVPEHPPGGHRAHRVPTATCQIRQAYRAPIAPAPWRRRRTLLGAPAVRHSPALLQRGRLGSGRRAPVPPRLPRARRPYQVWGQRLGTRHARSLPCLSPQPASRRPFLCLGPQRAMRCQVIVPLVPSGPRSRRFSRLALSPYRTLTRYKTPTSRLASHADGPTFLSPAGAPIAFAGVYLGAKIAGTY